MKILITGGAGFIGSHLTEFHLNRGDEVFVVDNLSTGSRENLAHLHHDTKLFFEEADILTWPHLTQHIAWADRIYHLAAVVGMYHLLTHPLTTLRTNILSCERLLREIAAHNPAARLIVMSSSEIYGPSEKERLSEADLLFFKSSVSSKWVYATTKLTDELFTMAYAKSYHIKATAIRLFNTIGPRQNSHYGMVVPRFVKQALAQEPLTVYGSGQQTRSFCDVRDIVVALDAIANTPQTEGEVLNLGQDQLVTIEHLANLVKKYADSASKIVYLSYKEAYGQDYEDILHRRPDLTKLNRFMTIDYQWTLDNTLLDLIKLQAPIN